MENRINEILLARPDGAHHHMTCKKMFGGLAYLYKGKMSVGIMGPELMARVPTALMDTALEQPGARPMDFTGRVMREFIQVSPEGFAKDADLERWLDWGLAHARQKSGETQD